MLICKFSYKYLVLFICLAAFVPTCALASGSIDATNRYAWSENTGWVDFGMAAGAVTVSDSSLSGYAYGENIGWISLNCTNTGSCGTVQYAVLNNGSGVLSGYAWSENTGWIDFSPSDGGVTINSSGVFSGEAYGENIGWINFNTSQPVTTAWRITNSDPADPPAVSAGNGPIVGTYITPSVPSRPEIIYPDGHIVYLDSTTTPSVSPPNTQPPDFSLASSSFSFTRDLSFGMTGFDIQQLQHYLNTHGFIVSDEAGGPGSLNHETTYFGPATRAAVIKFQTANHISPTAGYFGPITRGVIKSL